MRKITSVILGLAFIIVSVTGFELEFSHGGSSKAPHEVSESGPHGKAPSHKIESHPSFYPRVAHEWAGYLFITAGVVHIVLNKRIMLSYFKKK